MAKNYYKDFDWDSFVNLKKFILKVFNIRLVEIQTVCGMNAMCMMMLIISCYSVKSLKKVGALKKKEIKIDKNIQQIK